jgi:CheY-like chemotaxis protein
VILCTGYNEMISEDKAISMGIRKFILKPVDKDELAAAIRSALDSRSPL